MVKISLGFDSEYLLSAYATVSVEETDDAIVFKSYMYQRVYFTIGLDGIKNNLYVLKIGCSAPRNGWLVKYCTVDNINYAMTLRSSNGLLSIPIFPFTETVTISPAPKSEGKPLGTYIVKIYKEAELDKIDDVGFALLEESRVVFDPVEFIASFAISSLASYEVVKIIKR